MIGIDQADGIITFMPERCQSEDLMEAESASSSYPSAWLLRSVQLGKVVTYVPWKKMQPKTCSSKSLTSQHSTILYHNNFMRHLMTKNSRRLT
jgi:hypothetical protein